MTDTLNRCREEFEHWCVKQGLNTDCHEGISRYERQETRGAWCAWRFFWAEPSEIRVTSDEISEDAGEAIWHAINDELAARDMFGTARTGCVDDIWEFIKP
jgi:hypothetical protein